MSKNLASVSTGATATPSRSTEIIAALERFAKNLQGAVSELEATDAILAQWNLRTISPSEISALLPALRAAGDTPARIDRMRKSLQDRLRAAVKKQKEEIDQLAYLLDVADAGNIAGNDPMLTAARTPAASPIAPQPDSAGPPSRTAHNDTTPIALEPSPSAQDLTPPPTPTKQTAELPPTLAAEAAKAPADMDSQMPAANGWRPITVTIEGASTAADLATAQTALLGKKDVHEVWPEYSSRKKVVLSLRVTATNEKLELRKTLERLFERKVSESWMGDKFAATISAE